MSYNAGTAEKSFLELMQYALRKFDNSQIEEVERKARKINRYNKFNFKISYSGSHVWVKNQAGERIFIMYQIGKVWFICPESLN